MPVIHIALNGDGALKEINPDKMIPIPEDGAWTIGVLEKGMKSGRDSIFIAFEMPDGQTIVAQTSAAAFFAASNTVLASLRNQGRDPNDH